MALFIGILTFLMVVVCLILILLVLIQLPKKDAGAGVAFGGAATDALFGAGSGNVLTKTTKYMAGAFFVLSIVLSLLQSRYYHRDDIEIRNSMKAQANQPAAPAPVAPAPGASAPAAAPAPVTTPVIPETTPAPAAQPPSNAAPAK
jgi:preprotein translocase subunit SecG